MVMEVKSPKKLKELKKKNGAYNNCQVIKEAENEEHVV
jgi:hypothetical protein